jgi:hypothetical protein
MWVQFEDSIGLNKKREIYLHNLYIYLYVEKESRVSVSYPYTYNIDLRILRNNNDLLKYKLNRELYKLNIKDIFTNDFIFIKGYLHDDKLALIIIYNRDLILEENKNSIKHFTFPPKYSLCRIESYEGYLLDGIINFPLGDNKNNCLIPNGVMEYFVNHGSYYKIHKYLLVISSFYIRIRESLYEKYGCKLSLTPITNTNDLALFEEIGVQIYLEDIYESYKTYLNKPLIPYSNEIIPTNIAPFLYKVKILNP